MCAVRTVCGQYQWRAVHWSMWLAQGMLSSRIWGAMTRNEDLNCRAVRDATGQVIVDRPTITWTVCVLPFSGPLLCGQLLDGLNHVMQPSSSLPLLQLIYGEDMEWCIFHVSNLQLIRQKALCCFSAKRADDTNKHPNPMPCYRSLARRATLQLGSGSNLEADLVPKTRTCRWLTAGCSY
jgi:hypothetical protein